MYASKRHEYDFIFQLYSTISKESTKKPTFTFADISHEWDISFNCGKQNHY